MLYPSDPHPRYRLQGTVPGLAEYTLFHPKAGQLLQIARTLKRSGVNGGAVDASRPPEALHEFGDRFAYRSHGREASKASPLTPERFNVRSDQSVTGAGASRCLEGSSEGIEPRSFFV